MRPGLLILVSSLEAVLLLAASSADFGDESGPQASCADASAEPSPGNVQGTVLLQRNKQAVSQPLLALLENVEESAQSTILCRRQPDLLKVEPGPAQEEWPGPAQEDSAIDPTQEVFGDKVPLNAEGFKAVMNCQCGFEKELFVARVAKSLGLDVKNTTGLHEWMPEGVYAVTPPTFEDLKAIVAKVAEDQSIKWVTHAKASLAVGDENAIPDAVVPLVQEAPLMHKFPTLLTALGLAESPRSHPGIAFMTVSGETKPTPTKKKKAKVVAAADVGGKKQKTSKAEVIEEEDDTSNDEDNEDGGEQIDNEDGDEEIDNSDKEKARSTKAKTSKAKVVDKKNIHRKMSGSSMMHTEANKKSQAHKKSEQENDEDSDEQAEDSQAEDGDNALGQSAPLNQQGYASVSKLRSLSNMEAFIKRAIDDRGLTVVDEGALMGVVPYYSGAKATQSWKALGIELDKAEKLKKSWLASQASENADVDEEQSEDDAADEDEDSSDQPSYVPYSEREGKPSNSLAQQQAAHRQAHEQQGSVAQQQQAAPTHGFGMMVAKIFRPQPEVEVEERPHKQPARASLASTSPATSPAAAAGEDGFSEGQAAVLVGLVSRPELVGSLVTLNFFDAAVSRWAVSLDTTGESIRVRASNLRPTSE